MICYSHLIILGSLLAINGCTDTVVLQNNHLRDRVIACSAGFSDTIGTQLTAAYDQAAFKGELPIEFKRVAQALILEEMPVADRLAAYQDYINCIEKPWNDHAFIKAALRHKPMIQSDTKPNKVNK